FIKYYAVKRNLSFTVTKEYLDNLYKLQNGKCYYSGSDIKFATTKRGEESGERSASLDRTDSNIGYEENNVKWVHKNINLLKWSIEEQQFLSYIKCIVEFQKKFIPIKTEQFNHHKFFKGVGN